MPTRKAVGRALKTGSGMTRLPRALAHALPAALK
jgi:hypothetical protein